MNNEKLLQEIGMRIHLQRKSLGMTQERLAEKMDVSIQIISNLELGKKAIRPEYLVKLCNVLNTSADYILLGRRSHTEVLEFSKKFSLLSVNDQKIIELLTARLLEAENKQESKND